MAWTGTDRAADAVRAPFFSCPVRRRERKSIPRDVGRGRTRARWGAGIVPDGLRFRAGPALPRAPPRHAHKRALGRAGGPTPASDAARALAAARLRWRRRSRRRGG